MIEVQPHALPKDEASEPLRFAGVSYEWLAATAEATAMHTLGSAKEVPVGPLRPFGIVDFAIEDERPKPVDADGGMTKVQHDTTREETWNQTVTRLPNGIEQLDNQKHVIY